MKKLLFITLFLAFVVIPVTNIKAGLPAQAGAPVKILLVPGHDADVWGAQYGNIKEADMNLELATRIYNILKKDERFQVYITRDKEGYVKEFADYYANHQADILTFKQNAKTERQAKIKNGDFIEKENAPHNTVTENVSIILYGVNKWANENKMDAVIHIHFNDYSRSNKWTIGKYKGFAIYIPEGQMMNWFESGQLAADIFLQLKKKYTTSTYKNEMGGLVPDQTLIALGSNGTLLESVRSILIEYGYIYEKKFRNSSTRLAAYKDMANLTTAGIKSYFFSKQ